MADNIGNASVIYDGLGGLQGTGGPTSAFNEDFTPASMTWWGHQNDEEHVELGTSLSSLLREITFYETTCQTEHVEVSTLVDITLTDIHDL